MNDIGEERGVGGGGGGRGVIDYGDVNIGFNVSRYHVYAWVSPIHLLSKL